MAPECVDLEVWLGEIVRERAQDTDSDIRLDLARGPLVTIDTERMRQVMTNLIDNAVQAMAGTSNSQVSVSTKVDDDAAAVVIAVADTGPGIPRELRDKVFEPFQTTKKNGTGIGLSISRTIIEHHGGHMWASNLPQGGAAFGVVEPVDPSGSGAVYGQHEAVFRLRALVAGDGEAVVVLVGGITRSKAHKLTMPIAPDSQAHCHCLRFGRNRGG